MLPVLVEFGPIKIYSMGVFLMLGFFWGSFFLWKIIKLTSYKEEEVFDGLFISLFGGFFFARVTFVVLNFSDFGFSFLKFILVNGFPGLSLFGGLAGGTLVFFLFCRSRKLDFLELVDYVVPPLFLGLAFGKVGSFLSGSDVGTTTSLPIWVSYLGYEGQRHITALYESFVYFASSFAAYRLLMATRREAFFKGFTFLFFLLIFSLVSLLLDNFKENHLYFADRSVNFMTSLIVGSSVSAYLLFYFRSNIAKRFRRIKGRAGKHVKTPKKGRSGKASGKTAKRRGAS